MLANFLIGLREGLEAALIVGILIAYLNKTGNSKGVRQVLWGVAAATLTAILVGIGLAEFVALVPAGTNEIISGLASIIAVGFVTWMIFWMARQSRGLKNSLQQKIDTAAKASALSLVAVAFFSVIREGIETSVFIWSASRATGNDTNPVLGAALGLFLSAALGYLLYRGALRMNLSKFFKYTGTFLIVVAAGIFVYGVGELQEIDWLPFLTQTSFDLSALIPKESWFETLLRGTISFKTAPTVLETLVWFSYVIPVGYLYLRPTKKS